MIPSRFPISGLGHYFDSAADTRVWELLAILSEDSVDSSSAVVRPEEVTKPLINTCHVANTQLSALQMQRQKQIEPTCV